MGKAIIQTKKWIGEFVILHNLCPFAKIPFEAENILYSELKSYAEEQVLMHMHEVISTMENYSNAFLILPKFDFDSYLELFYKAEMYLEITGLCKVFQLASFHPDYQFDSYAKADKRNRTNQSPFPMIHILRVKEMSQAIASYGDTTKIIEINEKKMRNLES